MLGEVTAAGFQSHQNGRAVAGVEAIGLARYGVRLVDEGIALLFFASVKGSEGGEAAHAEHRINLMLLNETTAISDSCPHSAQETKHFWRPWARHSH